jgi:NADPH:quinone reductase-like Zn-dependent oxidoreductase
VIGTLLAYLAATAFIAIGLGALLAPQTSSQQYGLATKDATTLAYVRALGARDLVLGLLLLAFSLSREQSAAALVAEFGALAGLSDFLIVASSRGEEARRNLVIHGAGTIGLLAVWLAIRLGA